jgi:transposase
MGVLIKKTLALNPKSSLRTLLSELLAQHRAQTTPSKSSIHRYLKRQGYKTLVPLAKPLLSQKNKDKRLIFAKSLIKMPKKFFESIVWSDETYVQSISSSRRCTVTVQPSLTNINSLISPRIQSGGVRLMFWGAFSSVGSGPLIALNERVDSRSYLSTLNKILLPYLKSLKKPVTFMHDNAPAHASDRVKKWFKHHKIRTLNWPPQSPDLNPIENVWGILKNKLRRYETFSTNKDHLEKRFCDMWHELTPSVWKNLSESFKKRLNLVIENRGGSIKY